MKKKISKLVFSVLISAALISVVSVTTVFKTENVTKLIKNNQIANQKQLQFIPGQETVIMANSTKYIIYTLDDNDYLKYDQNMTIDEFSPTLKEKLKTNNVYFNLSIPTHIKYINIPILQQNSNINKIWKKIVRLDFSRNNNNVVVKETRMPMLKEVIFSKNVSALNINAFAGCSELETLTDFNKSSITEIPQNAFNGTKIKAIDLTGSKVQTIHWGAFSGIKLTSFVGGEQLVTIKPKVFSGMTKYNVNLPEKFNNPIEFDLLGIRKPDGTRYNPNDFIPEKVSSIFNKEEIKNFFVANKILNPLELVDKWNNDFNNKPEAFKFLLKKTTVNQILVETRNLVNKITAVFNTNTSKAMLVIKYNNLYTGENSIALDLSFSNTDTTLPPTPEQENSTKQPKENNNIISIVGASIGGLIFIILIVGVSIWLFKKRKLNSKNN